MMVVAQLVFILLTGPSGNQITLNPKQISTMHAAVPGRENKQFTEQAKCVINTTDGKFISVIETCVEVQRRIREGNRND